MTPWYLPRSCSGDGAQSKLGERSAIKRSERQAHLQRDHVRDDDHDQREDASASDTGEGAEDDEHDHRGRERAGEVAEELVRQREADTNVSVRRLQALDEACDVRRR